MSLLFASIPSLRCFQMLDACKCQIYQVEIEFQLKQLRFEVLIEFEVWAPLLAHRTDTLHEVGGGIALCLRVRLPPQRRL